MRDEDLRRLEHPSADASRRPDDRLAEALGIRLPAVNALRDAIAADLDTEVYGIGWWAPHPDSVRVRSEWSTLGAAPLLVLE